MKVELVDQMGDDLSIVNAARVSYAKRSITNMWQRVRRMDEHDNEVIYNIPVLNEADKGLINYLMKNKHGTPFEMVQFQFRVRVPIGVAREWQRHRIGSFNEVSTRYVEMEPYFYIPIIEHVRIQVGKPGHYTFETADTDTASSALFIIDRAYKRAYEEYKYLLELGVAKELARNVLPLGLYTEFIWSVNLRSLFNFLNLRTAPNALLEIRLAASEVEHIAQQHVPVAFECWNNNDRVAP